MFIHLHALLRFLLMGGKPLGQGDKKGTPFARCAAQPDPAGMGLDNSLDRCQPQACTFDDSALIIYAVEVVKDVGLVLNTYSRSLIPDLQDQLIPIFLHTQRNRTVFLRILDRIIQQVGDHPADLQPVYSDATR